METFHATPVNAGVGGGVRRRGVRRGGRRDSRRGFEMYNATQRESSRLRLCADAVVIGADGACTRTPLVRT